MLKLNLRHFVILFAAFLLIQESAAEILRIGDASNGASLRSVNYHALNLGITGSHEVSLRRLRPSQAITALQKHEVDMLVLDKRFLRDVPAGFQVLPYAAEALCIYLHPGNMTASLTVPEIKEILTEKHPRWSKYSSMSADIQRITLKSRHQDTPLIRRIFGDIVPAAELMEVSTLLQLFAYVNNPAAIGIAPFTTAYPEHVAVLPVNNIPPSTLTVSNGTYPLTLQYVIICPEQRSGILRHFIEAIFAWDERRKLPEHGLIPLWEVTK